MQKVIALDLEGVLIPEIWQLVSKKTGVKDLGLTTRDIANYDELMSIRINALLQNNITINDIQDTISKVEPLEGAVDFLRNIGKKAEVILLSDTFIEFFTPLRAKLNFPTIFCNSLNIDERGFIKSHIMRIKNGNGKATAVRAFQSIESIVAAAGDSYNDLKMLQTADYGAWFLPPHTIQEQFPDMPAFFNYVDLEFALLESLSVLSL